MYPSLWWIFVEKITKSHQFLTVFRRKTGESIWIVGEDGLIRVEQVSVNIPSGSVLLKETAERFMSAEQQPCMSVCLCACSMCAGVNNECCWVDWRDTQRPIRALCPAWRALRRNKYLQTQQRCSLSAVPPKRKCIYYLNVVVQQIGRILWCVNLLDQYVNKSKKQMMFG